MDLLRARISLNDCMLAKFAFLAAMSELGF